MRRHPKRVPAFGVRVFGVRLSGVGCAVSGVRVYHVRCPGAGVAGDRRGLRNRLRNNQACCLIVIETVVVNIPNPRYSLKPWSATMPPLHRDRVPTPHDRIFRFLLTN